MFDKFETLHRNHKFAFLDGVLCGLVAYHIGQQFVQDYREDKRLEQLRKESKNRRSMYDPKTL